MYGVSIASTTASLRLTEERDIISSRCVRVQVFETNIHSTYIHTELLTLFVSFINDGKACGTVSAKVGKPKGVASGLTSSSNLLIDFIVIFQWPVMLLVVLLEWVVQSTRHILGSVLLVERIERF